MGRTPTILVVTVGRVGVGIQQGVDGVFGGLQHAGLVERQEPKVAVKAFGDNPRGGLFGKSRGAPGNGLPILFQYVAKQHGSIFVVDFIDLGRLVDRTIAFGGRIVFRLQTRTPTGSGSCRTIVLVVVVVVVFVGSVHQFFFEFLHGVQDSFLVRRRRAGD